MARPPVEIDAHQVEELASIGCKTVEIADFFGVSDQTITRRFGAELAKGRSDIRMSLRRWQLESARGGNVVMLIWLGKQMLGQQEKTTIELSKLPDEVIAEEMKKRLVDGRES